MPDTINLVNTASKRQVIPRLQSGWREKLNYGFTDPRLQPPLLIINIARMLNKSKYNLYIAIRTKNECG